MKNKNKRILISLFIIVSILFIVLNVKADSGYDVDWGGGGSSWGGSDWGGSDGGGIYVGGGGGIVGFIVFIIIMVIFSVIAASKEKKARATTSMGLSLFLHQQLPPEQIYAILGNIDINQLLNDRFNDFVQIQDGWMNFNHDLLRTKLTDELYNEYAVQLDTMQMKNQQNVMYDFRLFQAMVTGISQEGNKVTMTMEMITSFYDYLLENGNVTRGKKDMKVIMHYELTFVCTLGSNGICPNCGAKLPKTNICDYCHSVVPNAGSEWIMAKKKVIRQK